MPQEPVGYLVVEIINEEYGMAKVASLTLHYR